MKIKEPNIIAKASLESDEIYELDAVIDILSKIIRIMDNRHFTKCLYADCDGDEFELPLKEVIKACDVLEKLAQLTGLQ